MAQTAAIDSVNGGLPVVSARRVGDGVAFAHRMTTELAQAAYLLMEGRFIITGALTRRRYDGTSPYRE